MQFSRLCLDLFLLSQLMPQKAGPTKGYQWEALIADHLAGRGVRIEAVPGACTLLNHVSLSGLAHQIDSATACRDAIVVGEWKAYSSSIPKNELLRFRAATEDYYMAIPRVAMLRPILRVFGGTGAASDELRTYAAYHGITLIDRSIWPAPVLASRELSFLGPEANLPSRDRRRLNWLSRPLQRQLVPQPGGGYLVPAPKPASAVSSVLALQASWSELTWELLDERPGQFETMLDRLSKIELAA
jgi:hypothetical protein